MFDRSALGLNHWLGFRFRRMLAKHIFKHMGKNVKIFHGVEFSFGYNLTIEDDCTIHKFVMLDDRGRTHHPQGHVDFRLRRGLLALAQDQRTITTLTTAPPRLVPGRASPITRR